VVTHVSESPVFSRKGDNLEVEVPISVPEALRGADVEVPTLDGTKTLRVKPGTRSGTLQRLKGEGPSKLDGAGRGDIHYRFVIDVPETLTDEQKEIVDDLARVMNGNPRERILREAASNREAAA
jgi:molecular chaperone DnaJ